VRVVQSAAVAASVHVEAVADVLAGPAFSHFRMTLEPGERTEAVGPFYYSEDTEDVTRWAIPPLFSAARNHAVDSLEIDFVYPVLTYDRFGAEYRFQILQLLNFAGGRTPSDTNAHRFSLFPFYLQQRSADGTRNYTSVLPFYGHLENRFFRDEIDYILMPLWVKTRKKEVITENYLYPVFHRRHGPDLKGWQAWPLVGHETKSAGTRTNHWGDEIPSPGHETRFVLWPFFIDSRSGIGGTNPTHQQLSFPFYSFTRSPNRDSTSIPFILGWTSTENREKGYREFGAPWPLVVFRRGETAHTTRIWPLYSHATNAFLESTWYLWPVYKYNRLHSDPLDRERTRWLLFLYSDTIERNTETGAAQRRRDCWPLFIRRQDWSGNERIQVLALLEPVLPNSKSIERNYSHLWSLWRGEKNPKAGTSSQSLLWNLYRRNRSPKQTHTSVLFGLVQHERSDADSNWRFFWWPKSAARDRSVTEPAPGGAENPQPAQLPPASE
jgi:hypothetical protein